jgi:hypothetical protein
VPEAVETFDKQVIEAEMEEHIKMVNATSDGHEALDRIFYGALGGFCEMNGMLVGGLDSDCEMDGVSDGLSDSHL